MNDSPACFANDTNSDQFRGRAKAGAASIVRMRAARPNGISPNGAAAPARPGPRPRGEGLSSGPSWRQKEVGSDLRVLVPRSAQGGRQGGRFHLQERPQETRPWVSFGSVAEAVEHGNACEERLRRHLEAVETGVGAFHDGVVGRVRTDDPAAEAESEEGYLVRDDVGHDPVPCILRRQVLAGLAKAAGGGAGDPREPLPSPPFG